jgi:methyl-accepting chemotaxis protein
MEEVAALAVARRAIDRKETVLDESGGALFTVGVPFVRGDGVAGAVVVSYSMGVIEQIVRRSRVVTLWFALAAIVVLAVLVELLARPLVHRPIAGIRGTMRSLAQGDFTVRAPLKGRDEIGSVAEGLNEMLGRMENLNTDLQESLDEATLARAKNVEFVDSYQRLLSLQEALAQEDQLAAIGQTAANIAHQIGTPLSLVSGHVQVIREEQGPNSPIGQRLEIVEDQIAKVVSVLRTMLDLTRRPSPREVTNPTSLVGARL